jgi:hypothetical protein
MPTECLGLRKSLYYNDLTKQIKGGTNNNKGGRKGR